MSGNVHRGRAVLLLREEHGITQTELALRASLDKKVIGWIEHGRHNPSTDTFDKIAAAFGLQTWELFRLADRLRDTMDTRDEDSPRLTSPAWRAA